MKGLLIHVGDDKHPGDMNAKDHSDYSVHLLPHHADPDLTNFTYGDWARKTRSFDELTQGDYAFFSFKFREGDATGWYVASYFRIREVVTRDQLRSGLRDNPSYKCNAHVLSGDVEDSTSEDLRILVGDVESVGKLSQPVRVDQSFWKAVDLRDSHGTPFSVVIKTKRHRDGRAFTVGEINGAYLRMPKRLDENQTRTVLRMADAVAIA